LELDGESNFTEIHKEHSTVKNIVIPFRLSGTGKGVLQEIKVKGTQHRFAAEGHKLFGGTDSAPSPLDYVLGALISCTQITAQIVANQKNVELGSWDIALTSHLDNGIQVLGHEGLANFNDVTLNIEVETNLEGDEFESFKEEVERRCPLTQLFRRSGVEFSGQWVPKPLA
jgi:putative redox protein